MIFSYSQTRILVTHSLCVLPQCDMIVVMKDGTISEQGPYNGLLQSNGAEFINNYYRKTKTNGEKEGMSYS